jgi:predicted phosphodiesterase
MLSADQRARILEVFAATGNKAETARLTGHHRQTVIDVCQDEGVGEPAKADVATLAEKALVWLRKPGGVTTATLAEQLGVSARVVGAVLGDLSDSGRMIRSVGDWHTLERGAEPSSVGGHGLEVVSDADGTYTFGAMGDTHLGSKYERLDALNGMYDTFANEGVSRVFHCGNWIDGEARFNRFDLVAHGIGGQLAYLAEHYPRRRGITTHAIAGDDHEGWYAQREGLDIGRCAEQAMRDAGRDDWHNLGYMEATVKLRHAQTGATATMAIVHPGGGSAYALSYTVQKIVESYAGGEKPAVLLLGHYHKLEFVNVRNVWCYQCGCTQDQTPFMRKKRLEAHIGGHVVRLRQDPQTGAIYRASADTLRYFVRSYANNRWSHSGPVEHAEIGLG